MLEDDFNDCLGKAIRGHGCGVSQLAHLAGISQSGIVRCLDGELIESVLHGVCPHLQLDAEKMIRLREHRPSVKAPAELTVVTSDFGHVGVNAYLLASGVSRLVFDTGTDATEIHEKMPQAEHLFITHRHPDHIARVKEFSHCGLSYPEDLHPCEIVHMGEIEIKVLDVSGHATPARAYLVSGLSQPLCIVGDALFAGSIGGCQSSEKYSTALANIRDHILSLPDETVLCPGHGPLTTVALEKECNPFF